MVKIGIYVPGGDSKSGCRTTRLNLIKTLKRKQKQTLSLPFFIVPGQKFTEKVSNEFPLQKKIFVAIMAVLEPVQRKAPSQNL